MLEPLNNTKVLNLFISFSNPFPSHCDAWNKNRLKLLPGKEFTNIATDSKKDDCTELANVTMPTNLHETGNLQKVLTIKITVRVMITMNIDVADWLTNGAMGTVTNVVIDQTTGKMSVILVAFDSEHVGQETRHPSVYNRYIKMLLQYIAHRQHFLLIKSIISSN